MACHVIPEPTPLSSDRIPLQLREPYERAVVAAVAARAVGRAAVRSATLPSTARPSGGCKVVVSQRGRRAKSRLNPQEMRPRPASVSLLSVQLAAAESSAAEALNAAEERTRTAEARVEAVQVRTKHRLGGPSPLSLLPCRPSGLLHSYVHLVSLLRSFRCHGTKSQESLAIEFLGLDQNAGAARAAEEAVAAAVALAEAAEAALAAERGMAGRAASDAAAARAAADAARAEASAAAERSAGDRAGVLAAEERAAEALEEAAREAGRGPERPLTHPLPCSRASCPFCHL